MQVPTSKILLPALLTALPLAAMLPGCGGGGSNLGSIGATPAPTSGATPGATTAPGTTPSGTTTPAPSGTATATPSGTATATPARTATPTPSRTATPTPSATATATPTPAATATPIPGAVPSFFDAFLADNLGQPANDYNGFFLWNATSGTVDLRGGNIPGSNDPEQRFGRYVDLDGGDSGRFATKSPILFFAGRNYRISFTYMSTDGAQNAATATLGSKSFRVATSSRTPLTFSQTFSFPTITTAPLVFQDEGNDDNGIGIDTVQVQIAP